MFKNINFFKNKESSVYYKKIRNNSVSYLFKE